MLARRVVVDRPQLGCPHLMLGGSGTFLTGWRSQFMGPECVPHTSLRTGLDAVDDPTVIARTLPRLGSAHYASSVTL